jgi:methionine synthase I (cobalamin-dependent)
MSRFLETLHSGRVLLMDGAMGTELQRVCGDEGECFELLNLTHPERVRAVYQAYLKAGAEVLLTNTFQANPIALQRVGAEKDLPSIRQAAVDIAYSFRSSQFVLLSVGPIVSGPPYREFANVKGLRELWTFDPLLDGFLLETCSTPRVQWALHRLTAFSANWPALLSLSFQRDCKGKLTTRSGHSPEWFAVRAKKWGASALGVNCGQDLGMEEIIEIIRRYRDQTDLPLFARPNAGTPQRIRNRWVYPHTPEAMAARLPELLEAGVSMVGGCCGTTPAHVAAFKPIVDAWNAQHGHSGKASPA